MKKIIKVMLPICIALILAGGLAFGLFRGKSWSRGALLKTEKGIAFWIDESGSPIELTFVRGAAEKQAAKLQTGDGILLLHDGILESYPGRTGCYFIVKSGGQKEIPQNTLDNLAEMGWVDAASVRVSTWHVRNEDAAVRYAEGNNIRENPVYATCGNTVTKLRKDGVEYSFMYGDSCALFNLLGNLRYEGSPEREYEDDFTVTLEDGGVYRVSLLNASVRAMGASELFGREAGGECSLTEEQCGEIRGILERVTNGKGEAVSTQTYE